MASPVKRAAPNAASKSSATKKRRFVTSCSECHRRKQKCNREKPCNFCSSRHVPELCTYALHTSSNGQDTVLTNPENTPREDVQSSEDPSTTTSITDQTGYSRLLGPNSYTGLPKLIQSNGDPRVSSQHSLDPRIYDKLKQTYNGLLRQLPSKTICDELVDIYLEEVNWYYMSLEGHYFMEMYGEWTTKGEYLAKNEIFNELSRDLQYFPALLFQVLANAIQFASPTYQCTSLLGLEGENRRNGLSREYSERGVEIMSLLGRSNPTITAVEHDLVRCEWLKNNNRGTDSWHSLGSAIRLGQEIGLHIQSNVIQDPNKPVEETFVRMWYEEYRRRLWARLFTLDAHTAVMLGRPRMIHRDDCDMKPLLDCDIPQEPFKVMPIPTSMQTEPSLHSMQIHLFSLSHKYHDMLRPEIRTPGTLHYDKVKVIHQEVDRLLDDLPPHMRPREPDISWDERKPHLVKCRAYIESTTNIVLMNLHRPHVSTRSYSRQAALEAALNVLNAQQRLFQHINEYQYKKYGFWFATLDSGLFLSSMVIDRPPQDTDLIERTHIALQQAIQRLSKLKRRSCAALSGEQILKQCYHRIQEVVGLPPSIIIEDEASITTEVTPSTANTKDNQQFAYPPTNMPATTAANIEGQELVPQLSDLSSIPAPQDLSHDYLSGLWDTGGTVYGSSASSNVFDTYLATQLSINGYMWPDTTTYPPS